MVKKGFSSKPITFKELGEFTEQVILPGVEGIIDKKLKPLEKNIMNKLDTIDFKISSQNEQTRKSSEHLHEWVKDMDERLTSLEAKR